MCENKLTSITVAYETDPPESLPFSLLILVTISRASQESHLPFTFLSFPDSASQFV
jgi:hypothetical protein